VFELIEFWVENRVMIEIATPDMLANYVQAATVGSQLLACIKTDSVAWMQPLGVVVSSSIYRFALGLAASACSMRLRRTSAREAPVSLASLAIPAITGSGSRTVTARSRPVAGRPLPLFWFSDIDDDII
jgi:hypothetical protein